MIDVRAAIALGGNLGNSYHIFQRALDRLSQAPDLSVETVSSWYRTRAIGPPQPDYLNGCAIVRTGLEPLSLLQVLLAIERQLGRVRRERWGPRTLDLDFLLYGEEIIDLPQLQVPHPRARERAFVLVPLAEIAPDWIEPRSGRAIADLAANIDRSGVWLAEMPPEIESAGMPRSD